MPPREPPELPDHYDGRDEQALVTHHQAMTELLAVFAQSEMERSLYAHWLIQWFNAYVSAVPFVSWIQGLMLDFGGGV